tara:strand:+ start:243 stop:1634 length:1392 start_codon:yes stop_codon:yes gene_type:complete
MSALALIFAKKGYSISGSDQKTNQFTENLISKGVKVFTKQSEANITSICKNSQRKPVIVISSAISNTNKELKAAEIAQLKILHRSELLSELINQHKNSILIGGSHGKTTTSAVIATLLELVNEDPTAVIGGLVPSFNSNGRAGKGEFLVAEADESDGTIEKFNGRIGIITNLELDHINHYSDLNSLIKIMKKFGNNCCQLILNKDCKILQENFQGALWFSIKEIKNADFAAIPIIMNGQETLAKFYEKGEFKGEIRVPLAGKHNLSNVIAAIAACRIAGIPFLQVKNNLYKIKSPQRRFQLRGIWEQRQIIDDYAHHPTEIDATISMARLMINSKKTSLPIIAKRLVVIFQPHRFSRTKVFAKDFAKALIKADCVILAPIYSAGEEVIEGTNNKSLAKLIKNQNKSLPTFAANDFPNLIDLVKQNTLENDLLLNMGAGDINKLWPELIKNESSKNYYALNIAA